MGNQVDGMTIADKGIAFSELLGEVGRGEGDAELIGPVQLMEVETKSPKGILGEPITIQCLSIKVPDVRFDILLNAFITLSNRRIFGESIVVLEKFKKPYEIPEDFLLIRFCDSRDYLVVSLVFHGVDWI